MSVFQLSLNILSISWISALKAHFGQYLANIWPIQQNIYTPYVNTSYIYIDIKFSGLSPIYPNITLRSEKVLVKKLAKIGVYVPLNIAFSLKYAYNTFILFLLCSIPLLL